MSLAKVYLWPQLWPVSELLKRNNLKLKIFDFMKFMRLSLWQVLCTMKAWESPNTAKHARDAPSLLEKIDRTVECPWKLSIALATHLRLQALKSLEF